MVAKKCCSVVVEKISRLIRLLCACLTTDLHGSHRLIDRVGGTTKWMQHWLLVFSRGQSLGGMQSPSSEEEPPTGVCEE